MSNTHVSFRWIVAGRWLATIGLGLVVAFAYVQFQAAHAQEKPSAPATKAANVAGLGDQAKQDADRRAAAALAESEPDKKDALPAHDKDVNTLNLIRDIPWLSPHMWAFYAIGVVSLIAVTFALERVLGLRRSKILPYDFEAGVNALTARKGEFDIRHATRLCKQYPSAAATVVRAMLAKAGRPVPEIEHALAEASEREATRLYGNVRVQNLAFNVAPMLGLAGTVHGMLIAFFSTAHMPLGQNKMSELATGIYAALVCTFAGLIVAIPAGIASHFFEGRILSGFQKVEDLARSLIPYLETFEGRSRLQSIDGRSVSGPSILGMQREDDYEEEDEVQRPAAKPKK